MFLPAAVLPEAKLGAPFDYTFCIPDLARSGATCGALAGKTVDPIGGTPPYSFSVQFGGGFLPPGLALEQNGLLRGTPTLIGRYTFGICAKDQLEERCQTVSIVVSGSRAATAVKISDITCQVLDHSPYNTDDGNVELTAKGTASGPLDANLFMPAWTKSFDCGVWSYEPKSHIKQCYRRQGDPESTTWSAVSEPIYGNIEESSRVTNTLVSIYAIDDADDKVDTRKGAPCGN